MFVNENSPKLGSDSSKIPPSVSGLETTNCKSTTVQKEQQGLSLISQYYDGETQPFIFSSTLALYLSFIEPSF
jgi:hypothetical protein